MVPDEYGMEILSIVQIIQFIRVMNGERNHLSSLGIPAPLNQGATLLPPSLGHLGHRAAALPAAVSEMVPRRDV